MQDLNNLRRNLYWPNGLRNLGCLTDVSDEILAGIPIVYVDGLHDNWQHAPASYRQL